MSRELRFVMNAIEYRLPVYPHDERPIRFRVRDPYAVVLDTRLSPEQAIRLARALEAAARAVA